jgi:acyl carrier protein
VPERNGSGQESSTTVAERVIARLGVEHPEKVVPEAGFIADLGADEGDARDLVMDLEEEFGVEITAAAARTLVTVGDVVKFIEKTQQSGSAK